MIYLIDDNKYGQMSENYKLDFTTILHSFPDQVNWLHTISGDNLETILSDASCILIHDSLDSKEDKERLVAMAKKKNILYGIFSNGFTATIFDGESIKEIKKDRLYNNLLVFIEYFIKYEKVDLQLLSLGQNYEAEKASIIRDKLINGTLFKNRNDFNYEVAFPSGSQEFKDLKELIYLGDKNLDLTDFEDIYNQDTTNAQIMREVIVSLADKVQQRYE